MITIKRDIPSPISNQSNRLDSTELINQLNNFNNNQSLSNNFVNLLQSSNESTKPTRPIKERTASGDGQFVCTICNRSYRHKHSLHRHLVCHRNPENNNHSLNNKTSLNQDQQLHSSSNELNCSNASSSRQQFVQQPLNGTSTPFANSTGRSSVDSVNSEEQNLKPNNSQQITTNQMFSNLNQEMLESLISSNLFTGSSSNPIHSPSNTATTNLYSNLATTDNSSATTTAATTTTQSNSTAMFSV